MGWNRFVNGYLDLMTLWFLSDFGKKPMHVLRIPGQRGLLHRLPRPHQLEALTSSSTCTMASTVSLITDSPYFFIALTAMLLGSQFFLAGFLGDLISRQNPNRTDYQIEKEIRCGK